MSTISPFVRIEGSINQPRSRAADSFPPPFGAEWALLSPEGSLRADLSALLRTFCLHDETIWSMCHWSSAWPRQPAVHLAEPASPFAMPPGEREHAQASAMPVAKDAPAMSLRGGFPPGVRVAGACAMGGAALLAWLAIGHLPQRHTEPGSASVLHAQPANDASGTARSSIAMPDEVPVQTHAPIASQPHLDEARHRHAMGYMRRIVPSIARLTRLLRRVSLRSGMQGRRLRPVGCIGRHHPPSIAGRGPARLRRAGTRRSRLRDSAATNTRLSRCRLRRVFATRYSPRLRCIGALPATLNG